MCSSLLLGAQIFWCSIPTLKCGDTTYAALSSHWLTYVHARAQSHTHTHAGVCVSAALLQPWSEAPSISVTQHSEVTLGVTLSLLQVLLAKVHMLQFISEQQFVKAAHFCAFAVLQARELLYLYFVRRGALHLYKQHTQPAWVCILLHLRGKKCACSCSLYPQLLPLSTCDSVCLCLATRSVCADCLICCRRAMAVGLQRISFIRLIREERSDERWEEGRGGRQRDGAVSGKHTPGAIRSQHLNTHLFRDAVQLLTMNC